MSTCPNSDLYSAWVDGEVPSPWKEKLEAHIDHCPECQKRAGRYRGLHALMQAGVPAMQEAAMEASFSRLLAKRETALAQAALAGIERSPRKFSGWTRASISLPLPALAALLVAAVFVPSWFALKGAGSSGAEAGYAATMPTIQQESGMRAIATSTPVYSPDLPPDTITANRIDPESRQYFTLIEYARKFANDKNLFSDGDIIIIKLPSITHTQFSGSDDQFLDAEEPLRQAAGFYR